MGIVACTDINVQPVSPMLVLNCPMWPGSSPTCQGCKHPLVSHPLHWIPSPTCVHYFEQKAKIITTHYCVQNVTIQYFSIEKADRVATHHAPDSCVLLFHLIWTTKSTSGPFLCHKLTSHKMFMLLYRSSHCWPLS